LLIDFHKSSSLRELLPFPMPGMELATQPPHRFDGSLIDLVAGDSDENEAAG
jgi:hypothetical protein